MKKAGIITLFSDQNYGNRLQNLAVQTILQNLGYNAHTIIQISDYRNWLIFRCKLYLKKIYYGDPRLCRSCTFRKFNRKYIKIKYVFGDDNQILSKLAAKYAYFVTGSDQVWNVKLNKRVEEDYHYYFLLFAEDVQKVCISPSIGLDTIPEEYTEQMRDRLSGFKYLSCREKQGAQEIKRITGRECEWLIDPTLYVTREQWKRLFSLKSSNLAPYILLYFMDGMSEELNVHVRKYAEIGGFTIIDPSDPHSDYYSIDPAQFVELLSNAYMVFTDSFHVTAFSINFHVPFYVFNRKLWQNMTSRIKSLCELFSLEERYIQEQKPFEIKESFSFDAADKQLTIERKKFSLYLEKCFGKQVSGNSEIV